MYPSTVHFFEKFTSLNDLAQVAAASVWTMRWQVKGFFAESGYYEDRSKRPSQADLRGRFLAGSGLTRTNFKSLVDGHSWSEQTRVLSEMTLLSIVSLFEGWVEAFGEEASLNKADRDRLQWPSHQQWPRVDTRGRAKGGVDVVIGASSQRISPLMQRNFYPTFMANRDVRPAELDALMVCYRYWKEIRNTLVHAGGVVGNRQVEAQERLAALSVSDVGMSRIPQIAAFSAGDRIDIDLSVVLNAAEILHKVVATLDAELSATDAAEEVMLRRWCDARRAYRRDPPFSGKRRHDHIKDRLKSVNFPAPVDITEVDHFLTERFGKMFRVPNS